MSNNRVTQKDLEDRVFRINDLLGTPFEPYGPDGENEGSYFIAGAYGGFSLRQKGKDGERAVIPGFGSKRELYEKLNAFVDGIRAGKAVIRNRKAVNNV